MSLTVTIIVLVALAAALLMLLTGTMAWPRHLRRHRSRRARAGRFSRPRRK